MLLSSTNTGQSLILQFAAALLQKRSSSSVISFASGSSSIKTLVGRVLQSKHNYLVVSVLILGLGHNRHCCCWFHPQQPSLSFSISSCLKFQFILDIAGQVAGQGYKPPIAIVDATAISDWRERSQALEWHWIRRSYLIYAENTWQSAELLAL